MKRRTTPVKRLRATPSLLAPQRRSARRRLTPHGRLHFEQLEVRQLLSGTPSDAAPFPLPDTFKLHSNPTATKVIYLDFDGHSTSGTEWNVSYGAGSPIVTPEFNADGNGGFSNAELEEIQLIWERVREDFIPFDVDVTTEDPGVEALKKSGGADNRWGMRVLIGGSVDDWYKQDAGGVAYLGSFNWDSDTPCFIFSETQFNDEKNIAEAVSHEVGHTLGLSHDGEAPSTEYYAGHGTGPTAWAPIMGVGYSRELSQWSKGEYPGATNTQDDLSIITTKNGFGYRTDDHGDTLPTAAPMNISGKAISGAGVVERNTDVDYFYFATGGGTVSLNIASFYRGPNLDILASLYNAAGTLIASSNPLNSLNATFSQALASGLYYLSVQGTGKAASGSDPGYSNYASLGQYTITGTLTTADTSAPIVAALDAQPVTAAGGTTHTFDVTFADNVALNIATIDGNDVRVIGPNNYDAIATLLSVSDDTIGTPRTATYQIAAPGGAWDVADNGIYTVIIQGGEVGDTSGNFMLETQAGSFSALIDSSDNVAPTLSVISPTDGQVFTTSPITITGTAMDNGGAGLSFIKIVNGASSTTQFFPANLNSAPFSVSGIQLADGLNVIVVQAFDRAGNASAPVTLNINYISFDAAAPTIGAFSATDITTGGGATYTFTVTYTDNLAVKISTLDSNDIRVTSPNGYSQLATFVGVNNNANGTPRTATYRINARGGTWDLTDNGDYTLVLRPNQVSDTTANVMPETTIGSFTVNITEAAPAAPIGVDASDNTHVNKVQVTWNASATATDYEIWRNTTDNSGTATKINLTDVVGTTYDDTTAVPGTNYWYWVKARNTGGTSPFSVANPGSAALEQAALRGPSDVLVLGSDAGDARSRVKVIEIKTGEVLKTFTPYGNSFHGGVRVAVADLNNDGEAEIITAPGPGDSSGFVKVFNLGGAELYNYRTRAYPSSFTGGVFVAAGDVNGDGWIDIVTTPGAGRAAEVKVWKSRVGFATAGNPDLIANDPLKAFLAFGSSFKGGATVAAGDLNGDGRAEIIIGSGAGMSPTVRIFDATSFATTGLAPRLREIKPFESSDRGGVFVAVGNMRESSTPEIIVGNGVNGRGRVELYTAGGARFKAFTAFTGETQDAPVHVAAKDIDRNDGALLEIVTAQGNGGRRRKSWQPDATQIDNVLESAPDFFSGYYVA